MPDSELDQAKDIIRKEQEKAAKDLLFGIVDLQDTLCMNFEENFKTEPECTPFMYANNSLIQFLDANPKFIDAKPRSIRDEDRKKILPGQHAGVFLVFGLEDGTILKVNFYGGLRSLAEQDLKDKDTTLAKSHTIRTDNVITQNTHINWQINYVNGPIVDSWIVFDPNNHGSFRQSSLKIDGEYIDCHPGIADSDQEGQQIKNEIFTPIGRLTKLVPSSV